MGKKNYGSLLVNPELLDKLGKTIDDFVNMNPFQYVKVPEMEVEEHKDSFGEVYALSCK